jgi:predicted DNA-binding transcriptional regulator YafY
MRTSTMSTDTQPGEVTADELATELAVSRQTVARAIDTLTGMCGFPRDDVETTAETTYLGSDGAQHVRDWLAVNGSAITALERVRDAHLHYLRSDMARAAAVEAARQVAGTTMEAIASEMQMTRDGVYKLLARHGYR